MNQKTPEPVKEEMDCFTYLRSVVGFRTPGMQGGGGGEELTAVPGKRG